MERAIRRISARVKTIPIIIVIAIMAIKLVTVTVIAITIEIVAIIVIITLVNTVRILIIVAIVIEAQESVQRVCKKGAKVLLNSWPGLQKRTKNVPARASKKRRATGFEQILGRLRPPKTRGSRVLGQPGPPKTRGCRMNKSLASRDLQKTRG